MWRVHEWLRIELGLKDWLHKTSEVYRQMKFHGYAVFIKSQEAIIMSLKVVSKIKINIEKEH